VRRTASGRCTTATAGLATTLVIAGTAGRLDRGFPAREEPELPGDGSPLRRNTAMISVVTHVPLKEGTEREWDTVMLARMNAAKKQPGWVGGQLLRSPNGRVIIGTWESRADWERWHHSREFRKTRRQLDGMTDGPTDPGWHEVVAEVRKGRSKGRPKSHRRATTKAGR
jgi:heme-degrading monooxygenase HmoA